MPNLHQFHYSVSDADAVTQQMLFIRDAMAEAGVRGNLFAVEAKGKVAAHATRWRQTKPPHIAPDDLVLIHHSQGNPALKSLIAHSTKRSLVYHNITPPELLSHDRYQAELCRMGREQLSEFRSTLQSAFTVSEYNAAELKEQGIPIKGILPLIDFSQWAKVAQANRSPVASHSPLTWLFVGKLIPHKNQRLLIESFVYFARLNNRPSRLILVGREDPFYGRYLKLLSKAYGVAAQVSFTGKISDNELYDKYRQAHAFVCLSSHEGFCVPIVEAMAFQVPVFSFSGTGLGETLGKAGVHLDARNPDEIALEIDTVMASDGWKEKIIGSYAPRVAALAEAQSPDKIRELLLPEVTR